MEFAHLTHSSTAQQHIPGAAYVSGVLRASRRTRVDDFDCTRTQGSCRNCTLRHVVSKRRRETASRNAQQSTRTYTHYSAHARSLTLCMQVRTIHARPVSSFWLQQSLFGCSSNTDRQAARYAATASVLPALSLPALRCPLPTRTLGAWVGTRWAPISCDLALPRSTGCTISCTVPSRALTI